MKNIEDTLKEQFAGPIRKNTRIKALLNQKLVVGNKAAAIWLEQNGRLNVWPPNAEIISQGEHTSTVYFLLAGEVTIVTSGNRHKKRHLGEHVGEMAAIEAGRPRSASVVTNIPTATLELDQSKFLQFLAEFPNASIEIAKVLAMRLRERDEHFRAVNKSPQILIISASESIQVAKGLQNALISQGFNAEGWWDKTFNTSSYTLPDLVKKLSSCDFAIAIGDPVDKIVSRGTKYLSTRDNVMLEYGMAITALGLERSILLWPKQEYSSWRSCFSRYGSWNIKMPSDLIGLNIISYERRKVFQSNHIDNAVAKIVAHINTLDVLQTLKPKY